MDVHVVSAFGGKKMLQNASTVRLLSQNNNSLSNTKVWFISATREQKKDEKLCCKVSTGTHQTHWVLNNTKVTTKSTVSFLFPVHTGSCLFAWSRRRSCWGCVGRRRKSWRPSPVSTPALNPRPGPGSMTSSASSKSAYWTSRRRRCGSSRNSCSVTNACARTQRWKKRLDLRDHSKTHPGFLFTFSYLYSTL